MLLLRGGAGVCLSWDVGDELLGLDLVVRRVGDNRWSCSFVPGVVGVCLGVLLFSRFLSRR